jgi:hypothetical protein
MGREEILEVMAKAIRSADKSYFNDDYSEQARTVMVELHRAGYAIMPHRPPDGQIDFIGENLPLGRLRAVEVIRDLCTLMVENARPSSSVSEPGRRA